MGQNKYQIMSKILPKGKGVWVPIDHGVSDFPIDGLVDVEDTITNLVSAGVNVIIAHKGIVEKYNHLCKGSNTSMIAHLSASTRHGGDYADDKVLVGDVDEALNRGALGVSCQLNIGSKHESNMIERMGELSRQAYLYDVPILGMVYVRGENINLLKNDETKGYAHAARIAFELGCDVAKTVWTRDAETFKQICNSVPIPLLIAGGPASQDNAEILTMVKNAVNSGASGVCMGRQIFSHSNPKSIAKAIMMIVHEDADVDEAIAACSL